MRHNRTALIAACALLCAAGVVGAQIVSSVTAGATTEEIIALMQDLEARAEATPDDIDVRIELGNFYYEANMFEQAEAQYHAVTEMDSTHAGAHLNLGTLYTDMGRIEEAVEELEIALSLEPENAMIVTNLGSAYYATHRFSDAMDMYRVAIHLDPDNVEAHFNMGVAFADAQIFDEAIVEWQRVIEIDPEGTAAEVCRDNIQMINEFRGE